MISPEKVQAIKRRMVSLRIREEDLVEKFVLGSGSGGQKINKTHSCVYLKHTPSGRELKCQATRSREMNRWLARRQLCERVDEEQRGAQSARQQAYEKIRRQKRRRSRRQKQRMLDDKHRHAEKKGMRKRVDPTRD